MRTIKRSTAFRRDLRRVLTNTRYRAAAELIQTILESLAADIPLQAAQKDHPLSGDWAVTEIATCGPISC